MGVAGLSYLAQWLSSPWPAGDATKVSSCMVSYLCLFLPWPFYHNGVGFTAVSCLVAAAAAEWLWVSLLKPFFQSGKTKVGPASVSWKAEGGDGGPQSPASVPLPLQSSNWEVFVSCLCHRRGPVSLTGLGSHRYRHLSKSQVFPFPF